MKLLKRLLFILLILFTITNVKALDNNEYIKELVINYEKIKLEKDKYDYTLNVDNNIEKVSVKVIPTEENYKVEIINVDKLQVGKNIVKVYITTPSQRIEYDINVKRKKKLSEDYLLKSLKIDNYNLNFLSLKNNYILKINKEKSLNIITDADKNKKITIEGNDNLKNGSIIKIKVIAENGSTNIYKIKIKKSSNLYIIPISILVLLIPLTVLLYLKKQKSKKNYSNPEIVKVYNVDEEII